MKLARKFYMRDNAAAVARDLLGKLLVVPTETGERVSGMIVETEAYLGTRDRAAHSFGGRRTARNQVTYGVGGHAYVFFVYGMYYQLNVVCGAVDSPHVVLIRAVEPVEGIEIMRARRSEPRAAATGFRAEESEATSARKGPRIMPDKNLTSGPGKLCIAVNIDRSFNGADLRGDKIWLENYRTFSDTEIAIGKRIGIDYAGDDAHLPLRFWAKGSDFVSRR